MSRVILTFFEIFYIFLCGVNPSSNPMSVKLNTVTVDGYTVRSCYMNPTTFNTITFNSNVGVLVSVSDEVFKVCHFISFRLINFYVPTITYIGQNVNTS